MKGLSLHSMQIATVQILFDVVLAMLLSIRTKCETKKKVNYYLIVNDSTQRTYNIFSFFFTTKFTKLNCL